MILEDEYKAFKQKQAETEKSAQLEAEARKVLKLREADEWLRQLLAVRFPTEKFQQHHSIAIAGTGEKIGPAYGLQLRGLGLYFYSGEVAGFSIYSPALTIGGCEFVTSFGEDFTKEDFFRAIDRHFGEPL